MDLSTDAIWSLQSGDLCSSGAGVYELYNLRVFVRLL